MPTVRGMTQPAAAKPLQIFKPGQHTAMNGARLNFSESDLQATVAAYNPELHEAPLVVGHPKHDLPAYGWVQKLAFSEGGIDATPAEVNPDFADMVAAKAFKKISASFYSPDAPQNPVPGVYYLRHVGFLGAQPPAIKGLRDASFSDAEEGVLTFSEWDDVDNASLWRSLRDWVIGKFGQDEADKAIPGWTVKNIEQGAQDELRQAPTDNTSLSPTPSFSEPQREESTVTEAEAAELRNRLAAQTARNEELEAAAKKQRQADIHASNVAFCEGLKGITPAFRNIAVATLDHLAAQDTVVEFGEGDARAPLQDSLKAMFLALPAVVEFGEHSTKGNAGDGTSNDTVEFAAPAGYQVNAESLLLHNKAVAHQAEHGCTYLEAVNAVKKAA